MRCTLEAGFIAHWLVVGRVSFSVQISKSRLDSRLFRLENKIENQSIPYSLAGLWTTWGMFSFSTSTSDAGGITSKGQDSDEVLAHENAGKLLRSTLNGIDHIAAMMPSTACCLPPAMMPQPKLEKPNPQNPNRLAGFQKSHPSRQNSRLRRALPAGPY